MASMPEPQRAAPSWVSSPWIKWSWLLVLAVVVVQSLNYHWRALPTSAAGYSARGRADYRNSRYEDAISNLSKAIVLDPKDVDSYLLRSEAHAKRREFARAMSDISAAAALRPGYAKTYAASGDVRAAAWDAPGAIEDYTRALSLDPDYARCYLERGKLLYDAEKWNDAAADLRRGAMMLLGSDRVTAQLLLFAARARAGDVAEAKKELSAAVKAGRLQGERFSTSARFLAGDLTEAAYFAGVGTKPDEDDDKDDLEAEAFFLAGNERLVSGDEPGALALLRKTLATGADTSYAYDRAVAELEKKLVGFHVKVVDEPGPGLAIVSVSRFQPSLPSVRVGAILSTIGGEPATQENYVGLLAKTKPGSPLALTLGASAPTR
jgi:tetratricopeptide (TPR) repeat protein